MKPLTAAELGPLPIDRAKLEDLSALGAADDLADRIFDVNPDWVKQSIPRPSERQLGNTIQTTTVRENAIAMVRAPGFADGFTFGEGALSGVPYTAANDTLNQYQESAGAWIGRQRDLVAAFITGPVDDKAIGSGKWAGNVVIDTLNLLAAGGHSDPRRRLPENGFNQMSVSIPRFVPANDTQAGAAVVGTVATLPIGLRTLAPVRGAGTLVSSSGNAAFRAGPYSSIEANFSSAAGPYSQKFGASAYDGALSARVNGAKGAEVSQASTASRLAPRVDVTEEFILKTGKNGSTRLQYGNPEGVHGLIVNVDKHGVLGFDIRAPQGGSSMSKASGTDMFLSAMQRLEQQGVQVNAIRGTWIGGTDSVNAAQYLANLNRGLTPQHAAANTWTGRMAASQGFTNVGTPQTAFGTTTVQFRR